MQPPPSCSPKSNKKKKKKDRQCTPDTQHRPSCPSVTHNHQQQPPPPHPHEKHHDNRKKEPPDVLEESGHPTETSNNDIEEQQHYQLVLDPLEEQLATTGDIDGLERLLSSVKGVPGRAAFRKNVKKALKKIRVVFEEHTAEDEETALEPAHLVESSSLGPPVGPLGKDEMLRLISDTKRARGGCECVMHMAPALLDGSSARGVSAFAK
jgi:hypothetical protein